MSRFFQSTARVEQFVAFVGNLNANVEIIFFRQKINDLLRKVMHVDNDFVETGKYELMNNNFQ